MPRRLILSATERDTLLALPESQDDLIRYPSDATACSSAPGATHTTTALAVPFWLF